MNIPDEALEAAAEVMWQRQSDPMARKIHTLHAALEAAYPVIVKHLADTMPIETLHGADGASVWLRRQA